MAIDITLDREQAESDMLFNAQKELTSLRAERDSLNARIAELQREQAAIHKNNAERRAALDQVRAKHKELEQAALLASKQAEHATGTPLAQEKEEAFATLTFQANTSAQELAQLERNQQEQDVQSSEALRKLESELKRYQRTLQKVEADIRTSEGVRQSIYSELGSSLLSSHTQAIQEANATVAQKELELDQARQKRDDCSSTALNDLKRWPALREQIKPYASYNDDTTGLVEAAIQYRRQLEQLEASHDIPKWIDQVGIDSRALSVDLFNTILFSENTDTLEQWLEHYREEQLQVKHKH